MTMSAMGSAISKMVAVSDAAYHPPLI